VVGEDRARRELGLRLLLDTNAVLWALTAPSTLSKPAARALRDPANEVFVSPVSLYEIGFKIAAGKLKQRVDLVAELAKVGFAQLPLTWQHAHAAGSLPLHHRDPWDRLLVAQAQLEGLMIVTRDRVFEDYGVPLLAA
jgi:PIN domain nuclease of toxin-antitoxin system